MADTKISALTAVGTPAGTDEYATNQGGVSKKTTLAQIKTFVSNAIVFAAGSATAGTWPKLTSGTLQTTPDAGSLEMDANCIYGTTDAGNRGYIPVKHFIRADATRTFTSSTASQAIFTSPANGRITLETGLYRVEGLLNIGTMSATSGNLLLNLLGAGTATVAAWLYHVVGVDGSVATAGTQTGSTAVTSSTPASALTAGIGTAATLRILGTFEVTAAGTMIPSISLVTANAAVLAIGSYLMFERLGSTTVVSVGQWD